MYLQCKSWCSPDGTQHASGLFLILFSRLDDRKLYACVRHVAMSQVGHFMMGFAKVGGTRLTLSGSYGSDGLTEDLDKYAHLLPYLTAMPQAFFDLWSNGGGWNDAGAAQSNPV